MPDWSYRTLFRPLLFLLPAEQARTLTLGAIGTLAKCPGGSKIIELMGHMKPPEELEKTVAGITFPTPVGLGAGLDTQAVALDALSKFGFGFVELGPVTLDPITSVRSIVRDADQQTIYYPVPLANPGLPAFVTQLKSSAIDNVRLAARLGHKPGATAEEAALERIEMIKALSPFCQFFTLDMSDQGEHGQWSIQEWFDHLHLLLASTDHPILIALSADMGEQQAHTWVQTARKAGVSGLVITSGGAEKQGSGKLTGGLAKNRSLQLVKWSRSKWPDGFIVGSGGIHEPADALDFINSGADCVQLHSGLVYSGPGLPKRINESLWQTAGEKSADPASVKKVKEFHSPLFPSWVWGSLLGIGMIVGGILAWLVAATRVVLPYDERFLDMNAGDLALINSQLLPFMSHDRISLAGTMISIGIIYFQLARYGLRRGLHWTKQVLLVSGAVGFSSFFLFLGYGYFDYLHAALAILLLPAFLIACRAPVPNHLLPLPVQLRNDRDWLRAMWGQLLFVIIGFGLTAAGIVISIIGVTGVFVPSDLAFLCATPEMMQSYNAKLIPLIAHDRAGFGGALVSDGLAVLLISLWGFRQGEGWIWWTLFAAGLPGFLAGIGIHFAVGYIDFLHLFPAYVAILLYLAGLLLSRPYLCKQSEQ